MGALHGYSLDVGWLLQSLQRDAMQFVMVSACVGGTQSLSGSLMAESTGVFGIV
jgi:hypothetical protein